MRRFLITVMSLLLISCSTPEKKTVEPIDESVWFYDAKQTYKVPVLAGFVKNNHPYTLSLSHLEGGTITIKPYTDSDLSLSGFVNKRFKRTKLLWRKRSEPYEMATGWMQDFEDINDANTKYVVAVSEHNGVYFSFTIKDSQRNYVKYKARYLEMIERAQMVHDQKDK